MPDALSKTVPIWCAVINIALQLRREDDGGTVDGWDTTLYLPPNIVSPSEKAQIQGLLPGWAAALEVCHGQATVPGLKPDVDAAPPLIDQAPSAVLSTPWHYVPASNTTRCAVHPHPLHVGIALGRHGRRRHP